MKTWLVTTTTLLGNTAKRNDKTRKEQIVNSNGLFVCH